MCDLKSCMDEHAMLSYSDTYVLRVQTKPQCHEATENICRVKGENEVRHGTVTK